MLDAFGVDYARVLDLYAGTGALGIEALSRGEGTADFIEMNQDAVAAIQANLQATGMAGRGRVYRMSALDSANSGLSGPYTLVLADPPYYDEDAFAAVRSLAASALADEATVIAVEHQRRVTPPEMLGPLPLYRTRRHGDSVVTIFAHEEDS